MGTPDPAEPDLKVELVDTFGLSFNDALPASDDDECSQAWHVLPPFQYEITIEGKTGNPKIDYALNLPSALGFGWEIDFNKLPCLGYESAADFARDALPEISITTAHQVFPKPDSSSTEAAIEVETNLGYEGDAPGASAEGSFF